MQNTENECKRLLVISNRLPVAMKREEGEWKILPGSGGLVSAMAPVLRNRGGTWIGWTGAAGGEEHVELLHRYSREAGYALKPVTLTDQEVRNFYFGFSNEIIWPLFHDFQSQCNFRPEYWQSYLEVNAKFARAAAQASTKADYIWAHDYHLIHLAWMLRQQGVARRTGFFLHIPFPPVDIFLKLPWRDQIIAALMEYDLVGFQTHRDRRNFIQCVNIFFPEAKARGRGPVISVAWGERTIHVGAFPIGIDYQDFAQEAATPAVASMSGDIHKAMLRRKIILGVDRLDYTKGIPQRLEAMRVALSTYPELFDNVCLVQVLVPSREQVPEYQGLKDEIERLVGEINGQFSRPGYSPIHYEFRSMGRQELVAYYRAAAMALVTPLRDGMNLVAKEYCACNVERTGVLFLSEFAGAAAQLQNGAVLVNPHNIEGVAQAIHGAYHMERRECRRRMRKMQEIIKRYDIYWWVDAFLQAAFSRRLGDFPPMDSVDYGQGGPVFP